MSTKTSVCAFCGKQFTFEVTQGKYRAKYCGAECRRKAKCEYERLRRKKAREEHAKEKPKTKTIVCASCGKEFTVEIRSHVTRQKYCPDCKLTPYERAFAKQKPEEKVTPAKKPGDNSSLDAKANAAIKLGISYGQWVALFEGR